MFASFSSKAIMAKARAMYGKHLSPDVYRDLARRKDVAQIASYLKDHTVYADTLADIKPGEVHRGQLESLIRKHQFMAFERLLRYDVATGVSYYAYPIIQAEIQQILHMLSLMRSGRAAQYITQYPGFLSRKASFSMLKVSTARSYDELMEALKLTPYAKVLMPLRPKEGEEIDYMRCETALRSYFYAYMRATIDHKFTGKVHGDLIEILSTYLELNNLTYIYRMKRFFPSMSEETVRQQLLPFARRISKSQLDQLLLAPSADEFIHALEQSAYSKYVGKDDFVFIEYHADRIRYHLNKRYLRFSGDAPTVFTSYVTLSNLEVSNLITIIEGVRYGVSPEDIDKMLVI